MNHGYDDDDDEDYNQPQQRGGPSGLLAQLMGGGMGGGLNFGMHGFGGPLSAESYDDYFKAYSVAVMGGNERAELLYGGKIVMPPSALAKLSSMDIPGPWTFKLRNPRNPTQNVSHAGVLEFIAEEGIVHLPAWMMKTLELNEGDPVRLTGAVLPKGKLVKIQAQSTDFLQVSDAKAVLESALRFYSTLTKGDTIEITYNSLTFEFLIMETQPAGPGISVIDTDLEVDFETPVGYVEPPRPAPVAVPTMADKLKIDLGGTTSAGSSRPVSRASKTSTGEGGVSETAPLESFTGIGQSLSGKRVKGKGLAKKIEEVDPSSKINRNDGPMIITPDTLGEADRKVPAALVLPEGKFFFGYKYTPFDPSKAPKKVDIDAAPAAPFSGEGNTLRKKPDGSSSSKRAEVPKSSPEAPAVDPWANLGGGNTLRPTKQQKTESGSQSQSQPQSQTPAQRQEIIDATMLDEDDFAYYDEDDDNDVIEIDSD